MSPKNVTALGRYGSRKKKRPKLSGIFSRNPVLVGGLLLAPAVVAAFSLKNAAALSITLTVVTLPTLVVASLVRRSIPMWLRIPLYSVIAAVLLIPAYFLVAPIAPTIFDSIGMYFSLMAFNSILYVRAEQFAIHNTIGVSVVDGLTYCLGFALAAALIGSLREVLAYNTFWGLPVQLPFKMTSAALPFAGFLILGLLAGIGRYIRSMLARFSYFAAQRQLRRRAQLSLPSAPVPRREGADPAELDVKRGGELT